MVDSTSTGCVDLPSGWGKSILRIHSCLKTGSVLVESSDGSVGEGA